VCLAATPASIDKGIDKPQGHFISMIWDESGRSSHVEPVPNSVSYM